MHARLAKLAGIGYRWDMVVRGIQGRARVVSLACVWLLSGCGSSHSRREGGGVRDELDAAAELPPVVAINRAAPLCARDSADTVHDLFCAEEAPSIHSLADLQAALNMHFASNPGDDAGTPASINVLDQYPDADTTRAVFLAHSTSLSAARVSSINPRAIILTANTILAFTRGAQQVELAALDRQRKTRNFYLLSFVQACNAAADGCTPGDLYTPSVESDWDTVSLQDAEELKNTPSDCLQCHQRGRAQPMLLMRELEGPWTHFFGPAEYQNSPLPEPSGGDLVADYTRAKGNEAYAGVPSTALRVSTGLALESAVSQYQPVIFDGSTILDERWPWTDAGYPAQAQRSPSWDAAYEAFKRGEQLALPYVAPRATDPDKLAQLTAAYQQYTQGMLASDALPELADIFPDDPQTRAEIGLQVEPSATPAQMLVAACGTCHNDVLDQSISRARFSVALDRMQRAELDVAIARLNAARDSSTAMPPYGRRQLDSKSLAQLIEYLAHDTRSSDDDALLEHAAQLGMAGGGTR